MARRGLCAQAIAAAAACLLASADLTVSDPKYLSDFLLSLRGKYAGESVRLQIVDWQEEFMKRSLQDFCAVAGCVPKFMVANDKNMFQEVQADLHYSKMCDGYIFYGAWMPEFAAQGLIEPLSGRIGNQPAIHWMDIYPNVRNSVAMFQDEVYMVPLDGDVIDVLYRDDLLESFGRGTPRTLVELAEAAEFFNGKDLNGDGEPGYGVCFSTALDEDAGFIFWAAMSPFLQTSGINEGVFFDPDTMEPKVGKPIFHAAMRIFKRLVMASPFTTEGPTSWDRQKEFFNNGSCAIMVNFFCGIKTMIAVQDGAKHANLTGKLSVHKLPGVTCDDLDAWQEPCPHGVDGVSYAPFYAGGGAGGQIRASADEVKKSAMFDYFTWMTDPDVAYHVVANPDPHFDPTRASQAEQFADPGSDISQAFLEHGWERRQLLPLKGLIEDVLTSPNAALGLRIPGGREYTETETTKHLVEYWKGDKTLEETIDAMTKGWRAVTKKYGLEQQRKAYRCSLNLGPYMPPAEAAATAEQTMRIVFLTLAIVLSSLVVLYGMAYAIRRFVAALHAERQQRRAHEQDVHEKFLDLTRLNFNMVLLSYSIFVRAGCLLKYERARELGLHTTLDTYEEASRFCRDSAVVFLSHQWLGEIRPDPVNVHFAAACSMLEQLIERCKLDAGSTYVWVDYTSIPQSNKMMQRMAIGSIQVYAALPKYFVCLVPDAVHELGHKCNAQSYLQRGWCRLEQWARVSVGGVDGMYSFTNGAGLCEVSRARESITHTQSGAEESWLDMSIQVCKGDFSHAEDRHHLTGVIAALWMYAVLTKDQDPTLFNAVESRKKDVFPTEFFPPDYISVAESVCANLRATDWQRAFIEGATTPVANVASVANAKTSQSTASKLAVIQTNSARSFQHCFTVSTDRSTEHV